MKKLLVIFTAGLALSACSKEAPPAPEAAEAPPAPEVAVEAPAAPASPDLGAVLSAQPEDMQARYGARNPAETLAFFGIEPGMTVVEALPGGGWYSKILLPYLGSEGKMIGVDYALDMFSLFGFFSDEALEKKKTWTTDFVAGAEEWRGESGAPVEAFVFGSMPEDYAGSADAVLMIRALHNLNRFEAEGGYLTTALSDAFTVLKPGGTLGVVQHQAAEDMPDDWANGSNGYLKQSAVIAAAEAAGFVFVEASDINQNPDDQPTADDMVWRLPPTLATSREDETLREEMTAIGESNRMTLKFSKPE
ncbi:MAG: methyltransferase [Pseudomonadota bacterium]